MTAKKKVADATTEVTTETHTHSRKDDVSDSVKHGSMAAAVSSLRTFLLEFAEMDGTVGIDALIAEAVKGDAGADFMANMDATGHADVINTVFANGKKDKVISALDHITLSSEEEEDKVEVASSLNVIITCEGHFLNKKEVAIEFDADNNIIDCYQVAEEEIPNCYKNAALLASVFHHG